MAKKTTKGTSGAISMSDLLGKFQNDVELIEDSSYANIDEWIPTGSYILNATLSGSLFGGVPNRRSLCLAGDSGCLPKDEKVKVYVFRSVTDYTHKVINVE